MEIRVRINWFLGWFVILPVILIGWVIYIIFDKMVNRLVVILNLLTPITDPLFRAIFSYYAAAGCLFVAGMMPLYLWTGTGDFRLWFVWILIVMQGATSAFVCLLINQLEGCEIPNPQRSDDELQRCLEAIASTQVRNT